jgi:hypothetical protein
MEIDTMEDHVSPIAPSVRMIRELISTFELCHHKADRWVHNIIEAIGTGQTDKGLGTRSTGVHTTVEKIWQNACAALSAWYAGCPVASLDMSIGDIPASQMLASIGERSSLKEWQIQRVIEKIRSHLYWPQSDEDPASRYVWILLSGGDYESAYHSTCPDRYQEHEKFWLSTVRTIIHDTVDGSQAELSLGLAIDMLWPCHWRFVHNLQLVLEAIGGNLHPDAPYAACGRNIALTPLRNRMEIVTNTLKVFGGNAGNDQGVDEEIMLLLGKPTNVKRWLAASLEKTIRLQLDPSAELRELSSMAGPDWITEADGN